MADNYFLGTAAKTPYVYTAVVTGFLSRATNLKPSRPPRLNALSSTLSPPSKQDSPDME